MPCLLQLKQRNTMRIGPENLEDPAIFDELVDSGLLNLDGCLTIKEVLGAKLIKTCDSLTPITAAVIDAPVVAAEEEAEAVEEAKAEEPAPAVSGSVQGVGAYVSGGKVVLSIKEGKDIYIELPI